MARGYSNSGGGITVDSILDLQSANPVQNAIVTAALNNKADTYDLGTLQDTVQSLSNEIAGKQDTLNEEQMDAVNSGATTSAINSIAGKANLADLATVATSGSYNDLLDKPQEAPIMLNNNFSNVDYWAMNGDSVTSSSFPWAATLTEITVDRPFNATDTGYNVTVSFDPASAVSGKLAGFCTFEVTAGVENTSLVSVKIYATENSVTPSGYVTVMHS